MNMEVTIKQAFSILDGRLSTSMDDIYTMLNFVTGENLFTHELPSAMDSLSTVNPQWFAGAKSILEEIKKECGSDDFQTLMDYIDANYSDLKIELKPIN